MAIILVFATLVLFAVFAIAGAAFAWMVWLNSPTVETKVPQQP
jgi:hypothetical protein